jgi:hypothetical protein
MRSPGPRTLVVVAAAAVALGGCAARQPARASGACEAAFDRADAVLREGLASYVAQMKRYAASRDPGASTAAAEERARARADAWSAALRPEVVDECRRWPEDRLRCVLAAGSPRALSACGLGALVTSFTDEVVASFAARPIDAAGDAAR